MSTFDIRSLRKNQAEKYALQKEQEEKEKRKQEELKRIENEEKMLQEIVYKHDFEDFVHRIDAILIDIHSCNNILEMDLYVQSFKHQLEQNIKFIDTDYCREEIVHKVTDLINTVSQNNNSTFNITIKDPNTEAALRITENIKLIMTMCKFNEHDIHLDIMDTSNDEELAKKLQEEDNYDDMEFHDFVPIHQRMNEENKKDDEDVPELMDIDDKKIQINIPMTQPTVTSEYYVGFDTIDDPELIQLSYFQNELMDD